MTTAFTESVVEDAALAWLAGLGVTARTAQRHLTHFVELGMLRRRGQGPATKHEVVGA